MMAGTMNGLSFGAGTFFLDPEFTLEHLDVMMASSMDALFLLVLVSFGAWEPCTNAVDVAQ